MANVRTNLSMSFSKTNNTHSVGALIGLLFQIGHPWRRATDAEGWPMNAARCYFLALIVAGGVSICSAAVITPKGVKP